MENENHFKHDIKSFRAETNLHDPPLSQIIVTSASHTADVLNAYLDNYFIQFSPLNRTGFNVLQILIRNEGNMSQTALSKNVCRSRYTITKTVDLLEQNDWVERIQTGKDRRVNNVTITTKGLEIIKKSLAGLLEVSEIVISCLDEKERWELRNINRKLRSHISELLEKNKSQNREPT